MKKVVIYVNTISPHQLPLAREIAAKVGEDNFRYVYTEVTDKDHGGLGWMSNIPNWGVHISDEAAIEWLENADALLSGLRCFDLFERRTKRGLKNYYMTERWLKPPIGMARLLHPRYFGYAWRLCRLLETGAVVGLPIGIHAARDMARLYGLMHGDMRCLFRVPKLEFEWKPGGRIYLREQDGKYCLDEMRMWGYFVESSKFKVRGSEFGVQGSGFGVQGSVFKDDSDNQNHNSRLTHSSVLRVLWVGRLLNWKRVDTIIRAVGEIATRPTLPDVILDIYGSGPEENHLKKMASKYGDVVKFHTPVPIDKVRKLMRGHDVYVLASNGYEGWGAVVSEALEEGMRVIGSYEAGASATMLPKECKFPTGDWKELARLLLSPISHCCIGCWTARNAADALVGSCFSR